MERQQRAEQELAEGTWADYADGRTLVELHCLFDGRTLLASGAVFAGEETDVDEMRADLESCEGIPADEATWIVVTA